MSDLVKRLRDGCNLQQRDGERAADRIEQLERDLAAIRAELDPQPSDDWPTGMAVRALSMALAAEKALSDELYEGGVTSNHFGFPCYKAYRKARGLE